MTPTLRIDFTVEDICKGFVYNKSEGRGLFGLDGKLTIQREFGIRNTIKKLNRQLEKAADSFGNITDI